MTTFVIFYMNPMVVVVVRGLGSEQLVGSGDAIAKISPSPSEAGLSKLYNHGGPPTATARTSESKLLDFVGS